MNHVAQIKQENNKWVCKETKSRSKCKIFLILTATYMYVYKVKNEFTYWVKNKFNYWVFQKNMQFAFVSITTEISSKFSWQISDSYDYEYNVDIVFK